MSIKRFPRTFWAANTIELFERIAYYGMNIILAIYLTRRVGFGTELAVSITGIFISSLYLLPIPAGALSDKIGFRNGLFIAFSVLAAGYGLLGAFPAKATVIVALALIAIGGAFVKPVISGTIKKTSPEGLSRIGFSIFYMMVNVGGFTGKMIAKALRQDLGRWLSRSNYAAIQDWVHTRVPPFAMFAMLLLGLIPTLWGACLAIATFALGEMTFAPRFFDYVSEMAPPGKVGLYLGYSYLRSFFANLVGGPLSGFLVARYIPETGSREPYRMWFIFAAVGAATLVALFLYTRFVGRERKEEALN